MSHKWIYNVNGIDAKLLSDEKAREMLLRDEWHLSPALAKAAQENGVVSSYEASGDESLDKPKRIKTKKSID